MIRSEDTWWVTGIAVFSVLALIAAVMATKEHNDNRSGGYIGSAKLVTDPVNGCQYLVDRGITPRLRPDGKQICLGRQENGR